MTERRTPLLAQYLRDTRLALQSAQETSCRMRSEPFAQGKAISAAGPVGEKGGAWRGGRAGVGGVEIGIKVHLRLQLGRRWAGRVGEQAGPSSLLAGSCSWDVL